MNYLKITSRQLFTLMKWNNFYINNVLLSEEQTLELKKDTKIVKQEQCYNSAQNLTVEYSRDH